MKTLTRGLVAVFVAAPALVLSGIEGCGGSAGTGPVNPPPVPPPPSFNASVIDFEDPVIPGNSEMLDPYVDSVTGIKFTAFGNEEVIGPVKNSAALACVPPANNNQLLGTGLKNGSIGVGHGNYWILVEFPEPLPIGSRVEFDAQTERSGIEVAVSLSSPDGSFVTRVDRTTTSVGSGCYSTGENPGVVHVDGRMSTGQPVSSGIIVAEGGASFVIDNFTIITPIEQ